jgi:hydroxyacylglutathione hydrolase
MTIHIEPIRAFSDNYIWAIHDTGQQQVAIVDPGDAEPVLEYVEKRGMTPVAILITHHHWDHVNGVEELFRHYRVPVYGPAAEKIPGLTDQLKPGDTVSLPELDCHLLVLDLGGHTAGHIGYYGHGALFCGDTLFSAGCGRLFEGTAAQMHGSLSRIAGLPGNTQIYCAHEYTLANLAFAQAVEPDNTAVSQHLATVRSRRQRNLPSLPSRLTAEKSFNPFLRTEEPAVQAAAAQHSGQRVSDSVTCFAVLRRWKDRF